MQKLKNHFHYSAISTGSMLYLKNKPKVKKKSTEYVIRLINILELKFISIYKASKSIFVKSLSTPTSS